MPNRILRDWTDSPKMRNLSPEAERFFTRLLMKADDYGCFYGDETLLKANLFPFLINDISDVTVKRWTYDCHMAGIITIYESGGNKYIQVVNFKQRLRTMKSRFPRPEEGSTVTCQSNDGQMTAECPPEEEVEVETEEEVEYEGEGVRVRENVFLKEKQILKLKEKFSDEDCEWMFDKLSAYKLSKGKRYKSDYGAILSWVVDSLSEVKKPPDKQESKAEKTLHVAQNLIKKFANE